MPINTGNKVEAENAKNRMNLEYMARTYKDAPRMLIRINPEGVYTNASDSADGRGVRRDSTSQAVSWKRYADMRDWIGFFVLNRTRFPTGGSMLYLYYSDAVKLFPGRASAVGLAHRGPRYDADDADVLLLRPDWTAGCDPVIFGCKDQRKPFALANRSTLSEVFGAGFGRDAKLPWLANEGTKVLGKRKQK
jgi:hypothetical protein